MHLSRLAKHTTVSVTKGVGVQKYGGAKLDDRRRGINEEHRKGNSSRRGVERTALSRSRTGRIVFMMLSNIIGA